MKYRLKILAVCYQRVVTDEERVNAIKAEDHSFKILNNHLEKNKFFAGDILTLADISLYETFYCMKLINEDACKEYPNFYKFEKDFESQEWFIKFRASERYVEKPLHA
jgi:glutathione S-transferase